MRERLLAAERVKAIEWRDGTLRLLDQRLLPQEEVWLEHESAAEVAKAIRDMVVRCRRPATTRPRSSFPCATSRG
ncbi:hypothetical protein NAG18_21660, partial [Pseudomonas aeruginosa]|nr:hypothetical protein [Pseudomonas aeruginosa]